MQIKTISKTIATKMTNWLSTIEVEDPILAKEVKKNLLVSGGCIVSMLLNETVNYYDVYLKDINVVKRLTEFYIKKSGRSIRILDGREKQSYLDERPSISEGFGDTGDADNAAFSVAVRNLKEDQIKIFLPLGGQRFNEEKKEEDMNYDLKFLSPNAISLSNQIQIVIRFHGDNEAIHKTYDFIHATNFFTFDDGLVTNKAALESIITRRLKYQGSLYPVTSIIRMKKFVKRDWNIGAGEILKILFQVSQLNLSDPDILEEQLIGVDIAYFGKLIEILRNVKEDKQIDSHYLNTIIDKVFDSSDLEND